MLDASLTTQIMNAVDEKHDEQTSVLADLVKIPSTRFKEAPAQDMMARLFRDEMNLGFGAWRQQLRLERAIELMVRGLPLGEVAARMGYESQSAFSAMFRRALGVAPSRFIDDAAVSGPSA